MTRFVGIDIGAESVKVVELVGDKTKLQWTRKELREHNKRPGEVISDILSQWDFVNVKGATVTGRLSRQIALTRVPPKQAIAAGYRYLHGDEPGTVVSIGSHGFCVAEMRDSGNTVFRENSRCSQGTGNFLRQLTERFNVTIEQAATLVDGVTDPAPLSGRCPVILKTDMTHLANLGESQAKILAGLFDAVCENVQVLIKPYVSPPLLMLCGGVSRSQRVRENFRHFCKIHDMVLRDTELDYTLYLEALGCALIAAENTSPIVALDSLIVRTHTSTLERLPALSLSLNRVQRQTRPSLNAAIDSCDILIGLDIGSTGSKAVAIAIQSQQVLWESYQRTNGNPVGAAINLIRAFCEGEAAHHKVMGFGVTGSGRDIVGSLLTTCYGHEAVYVINEIAAHAQGALFYDKRVDTIFEIGGQDAKYIRLDEGRVIDAAMNEACSAGTGSFIEEQGKRFANIKSVADLSDVAMHATDGVALGQHCSVFMAEIIDEAVAAGVDEDAIIAGLYDAVMQNYLNRVKGSRSVGNVIFCQGMPFASDALAAAVARQTHATVIIPPSPGMVGALGIALLAQKAQVKKAIDLSRFLSAKLVSKDTFICKSTVGCGGTGNKCRIDRICTEVGSERQNFNWGGSCSLYDKGTRKRKLPNLSPDPFRQRDKLIDDIAARVGRHQGRPTVAMTDEFQLKGLYPFFATFIEALGFNIITHRGADRKALKRGIAGGNVAFCAPMQQYHGLFAQMLDSLPDYVFTPMIRHLPRVKNEPLAVTCPVVQAAPDMLALDLAPKLKAKLCSPVIDIGSGNLDADVLLASCSDTAAALGITDQTTWRSAYYAARKVQLAFDAKLLDYGKQALEFCVKNDIIPVVVLGRNYTIYNQVLNSNVPTILREQGVLAIPIDCYPIDDEVPTFHDMFWAYGQRILRAAHQIRDKVGIYSLFCSNYSCGPDSFTMHFYSYIMEGKPFAIIETDGHSGDAGTKTRVEAFLHCVRQDFEFASKGIKCNKQPKQLKKIEAQRVRPRELIGSNEIVLIPRMGPGAEPIAAALTGFGIRAEALPQPDREALNIGRRYTSGKECVPMTITLGSLLQRIEQERDSQQRFAFLMPGSRGPCRFGAYKTLHKIVLERLGLNKRVRVWSPPFSNYFEDLPGGFTAICFSTFMAADLLLAAYHDARPSESHQGAARTIYSRYTTELNQALKRIGAGDLSTARVLAEVASGRLYGLTDLLARAAVEFAQVKEKRDLAEVLVVGEIYVRCDPFANDFIIDRLAERGIRARLAPMNEWIEYSDFVGWFENLKSGINQRIASIIRKRIQYLCYATVAQRMGFSPQLTVEQALNAASPYVRKRLEVETILTLGGPIHEWRHGRIDAVVSTGPLECMPNKIAESQYFHVAEREGLLSLSLSLNGDPVDQEIIDNFAYEVKARHKLRKQASHVVIKPAPAWAAARSAVYAIRKPLRKLASLMPFPLPFVRRAEDE
ncbi:MAG: CoA activase [Deltaproteobacteria bacterium]|nr:CoA activase [Deltaproteobacteria bacterium]